MKDPIERQDAIDAINRGMEIYINNLQTTIYKADANNALTDLPSAQSEQKKGKWILYDLQDANEVANGNFYYVCSCCGKGDIHAKSAEVPYCWYCGARMDEVEK